jgi:peroxiredoxin Q/BCP
MLDLGDAAPDFAVGKTTLRRILEERSAVVFFFPKAFTPGWTQEAGGFRREYESLQKDGAEVVGVSADDQPTADRFRESLDLPYPLVGDPDGVILKAWGVRIPVVGVARRVTFVVGRDGRVQHRYESNLAAASHVGEACAFVARRRSK